MACLLPIDVVDSIVSRAITTADCKDAARLALVNKRAAFVYKQNVDVAQEMMMEIAKSQSHSSAFFKVCIKAFAKGRVVSVLEIRRRGASIRELNMEWHEWNYTDYDNFVDALRRMVNVPHLRDVRTTVTFNSLDESTMMPAIMRFVQFLNSKCIRK